MNNLTRFKIIAAPRQAISKLSRAQIPVYDCKKQGAHFAFSVPDNFVQKVFAIFAHPCYNIVIEHKSPKTRFENFIVRRAFLVAGLALFAFSAYFSNSFVFRVEVTGAAHLENAVKGIAYSLGVRENSFYKGVDEAALVSQVLNLPDVTFCTVHKSGSILYIDVREDSQNVAKADYSPLVSDCSGTLKKLVAVCGTAAVEEGQKVRRGDVLIEAYTAVNEEIVPGIAVGYAVIECSAQVSYSAAEESEENLESAYASALLYADGDVITERSHSVQTTAEGVIYCVNFTYLHTISINFD